MRPPRPCCFFAFVVSAAFAPAASFDDRIAALFRPPLGEPMALSPDGARVAYTQHDRGRLTITIVNLENPGPKRTIAVEPDPPPAPPTQEPTRLRFLRWATPDRLIFSPTERVVPLPPVPDGKGGFSPNPDGPTIHSPIFVVDAEGKQRGTLVDARNFQETPEDARRTLADLLRSTKELQATRTEALRWRMPHLDILGFLPRDREQLIIQTRGGYSLPTQHLVDIRTGSVREFGNQWPAPPGEPHVFDAHRLKVVGERKPAAHPLTAWQDDDLARLQRQLELKFPRRSVEMLDWNETRSRVLFRVTGGSDAGRVFVFQRPEDLAVEILRRAPWLPASQLHATRFFEFNAPDGARLSGYLTWPGKPPQQPPPLVVVFPSGFPGRAHEAFDAEAQALADLGFAVARLNHRCVAGVRNEDVRALRAGLDRTSTNDARAVIDWLVAQSPQYPFDRTRVAALGRGFGGYLAVRALQLEPTLFRCGVALDAPLDLQSWLQPQETGRSMLAAPVAHPIPLALLDHAGTDWRKLSAVAQADALTRPLFLLNEPGRSAPVDTAAQAFRARLQELGRAPEYLELDAGFAAAQPTSRAAIYRKLGEFLSAHFQDFAVKIGAAKEVQ